MFTLIIPYHNRATYLPRLFQSLLRCTVLPAQIILVDNASTDDSAACCQSFMERHPELPVCCLKEARRGASFARNAGLAKVTTEWVYFFDSDDELSPDYFGEVLSFLQTHPDLDLIASSTTMVFADGQEVPRKVLGTTSAADQILSSQLATQGMFIRTSFLRQAGGWNEDLLLWDDWELGFRLLHQGARTAWLPRQAWHRIHQHGDSITGTDFGSRTDQIIRALAAVCRQLDSDDRPLARALAFRQVLIAGKLYAEGCSALSQSFYQHALSLHNSTQTFSVASLTSANAMANGSTAGLMSEESAGEVSASCFTSEKPTANASASCLTSEKTAVDASASCLTSEKTTANASASCLTAEKTAANASAVSHSSENSASTGRLNFPYSYSSWPYSRVASLFLRLLYHYTRWGGRGGWYLAVRLTRWLS